MNRDLTPGEQRALHMIARVLDQQADEEPNRWYAFQKRRVAVKAIVASQLPLWLVRRNQKEKPE